MQVCPADLDSPECNSIGREGGLQRGGEGFEASGAALLR